MLSSTTSGYEGTGRALTLKLLATLRGEIKNKNKTFSKRKKPLREVSLEEPIRYSAGDKIELWLSSLLCLEATSQEQLLGSLPHPSKCGLFLVDRDKLFSGHAASESFLNRLMSLYVSAHYRNSPNDLQLLSDAPAHRLFALISRENSFYTLSDKSSVVLCNF